MFVSFSVWIHSVMLQVTIKWQFHMEIFGITGSPSPFQCGFYICCVVNTEVTTQLFVNKRMHPSWNQQLEPENGWLEDGVYFLGWPIFRGKLEKILMHSARLKTTSHKMFGVSYKHESFSQDLFWRAPNVKTDRNVDPKAFQNLQTNGSPIRL